MHLHAPQISPEVCHPQAHISRPLSQNEYLKILNDIKEDKYKLLYVAPERLDSREFMDLVKDKNYIIFVNKNDLPSKIDLEISKYNNIVYGNTLTTTGIKELKEMITTIFNLEKISTNDATYITNARHKALIEIALNYLNSALENIANGYSVDMLEIDIRACWDTLGEIIGETYKDELLDELFSNFCLGK